MPKIYIKTFGCQMNIRDSEVIAGLLLSLNYQLSTNENEADVIIFNTCSVRKHAEDKVWSALGRFRKFIVNSSEFIGKKQRTTNHKLRTKPIIGLVGCMAQNYKQEIFKKAPQVDFVVGPSDIHKIPQIIRQVSGENLFERRIWHTDGDVRPQGIYHTGFYEDKEHAYVVISQGCSNFCSYCVVPYVRGHLRSRDHRDIIKEIEQAVDKGITKITLLGQNVCAYDAETAGQKPAVRTNIGFIKLLELVNRIKRLKEFSFITSHPKDTTVDLFKAMQDLKKLKKYLHLPVQSGSDKILKLMNRGYSRKYYLDLVQNYRKIVKDAVLTTDIIVGFPQETREDFQATRELLEQIEFNAAYIFKYSPRPHTKAAQMQDDVPLAEKESRHRIILDLQKEISTKKKCLD
jgi:tRNA-2-methylthio-N6-dimethylallyladenosine synthase